jgi:drug/metabolite transporter (DMT)-like permease
MHAQQWDNAPSYAGLSMTNPPIKRAASAPAFHALNLGVPEVLLLLVAAVWGGSYGVTKLLAQQWPVLDLLTLRFGLTFLILSPTLRPLFTAQWRGGLAVGSILGLNLLAVFLCETYGVTLTTAANAALLISLCVALTPLVEWALLGQPPTLRVWQAAGLSVIGAGLLSATSGIGRPGLGDALVLLAALLRAVMVTQTRRLAARHALPALTLTAVQSGVVTVGLAALVWVWRGPHWPPIPLRASFWAGMAFLVLLCTVFAFFAQNYAASRTSPSRVSLLMGSEPLFGVLVGVALLGEKMTIPGWLGGGLMVFAAWHATRLPNQTNETASALCGLRTPNPQPGEPVRHQDAQGAQERPADHVSREVRAYRDA